MKGWGPILTAARAAAESFAQACCEPRAAQLALLDRITATNRDTAFGRAHRFADIDSLAAYRASVPIRTYEEISDWIGRTLSGGAAVLTTAPTVAFEETGGSAAGPKLIPYTAASLLAFRAAVLPWLADLARHRPLAFAGTAYAAISPAARSRRSTAGGIPIGVSESAYLGADLAPAFAAMLAVPPDVGGIANLDAWRDATVRHLAAARDLSFISVWSPTFLLVLIEHINETSDLPLHSLWPRLDTISVWADGSSHAYAQRLREVLPHAHLQPKGLMATEGPVTIPWNGARVPAIESGFFEFIDSSGAPRLCDELHEGENYGVVMTTPGGLYRYDLGDRVRCEAIRDGLPDLAFIGRAGIVGDLVGEKLSEEFVAAALRDAGVAACLASRPGAIPHYELLADAPAAELAALTAVVETRLCANPQYAYARRLGQLAPLALRAVPGLIDRYAQTQLARGRRLGDIKPPVLIRDPDTYAALIRQRNTQSDGTTLSGRTRRA